MPELPEVEVTRQGVEPHLVGERVNAVHIYDGRLRWPVPKNLSKYIVGEVLESITRRGKYLLLRFSNGYLIIHLGMTGVLRVLHAKEELKKHDRIEIVFGKKHLRFHDPRKFGAVLWHDDEKGEIDNHPLLKKLGVEPFSSEFSGQAAADLLYNHSRGRSIAIKQWLLSGAAVVGVGNIYCSETLFEARIHPQMPAGRLTRPKAQLLAEAVRKVLSKAIKAGGSTLKDFVNADGERGYFMMQTKVYDRAGLACHVCKTPIRQIVQGQRSTYFCPTCQKR
ncbi:MAG: bifunctional DNA-formamidopyrimidine glycosylase/DNA-(apurinic or apyrimidinic site) lyase [Burkholderiaceae bacterium]|jgi:formamidopyrimidine-DNA glycosylase|nr:bifunctional DNA-formamidopyrimidine glycosylase/DNA-(apurinic or apyrimidinic site) lyase [Burkholderiaceae bacterium]